MSEENSEHVDKRGGIILAFTAAALYAISTPFSKLLLMKFAPTMLAAFLYLGAGLGILICRLIRRAAGRPSGEIRLSRRDLPYTAAMVLLDIAAPVMLLWGLSYTAAANVSLLNNFEIVATAVIALCFFGEKISGRLWLGIALVTAACALLSAGEKGSFSFSPGSLLVIGACVCWGIENNCTRKLSAKDPAQTVIIKGLCSGSGSLIIALIMRETFPGAAYIIPALLLGFVAYGLSIFCYIGAQRALGAARTSAYYAVAPFIGSLLSFAVFRQLPDIIFIAALITMAAGTYFVSTPSKIHRKKNGEPDV